MKQVKISSSNFVRSLADLFFNAPISLWLNNETKDLAKNVMYSSAMHHLTNAQVLDKLWQEHESQNVDHGLKLFGLTCLGIWLE